MTKEQDALRAIKELAERALVPEKEPAPPPVEEPREEPPPPREDPPVIDPPRVEDPEPAPAPPDSAGDFPATPTDVAVRFNSGGGGGELKLENTVVTHPKSREGMRYTHHQGRMGPFLVSVYFTQTRATTAIKGRLVVRNSQGLYRGEIEGLLLKINGHTYTYPESSPATIPPGAIFQRPFLITEAGDVLFDFVEDEEAWVREWTSRVPSGRWAPPWGDQVGQGQVELMVQTLESRVHLPGSGLYPSGMWTPFGTGGPGEARDRGENAPGGHHIGPYTYCGSPWLQLYAEIALCGITDRSFTAYTDEDGKAIFINELGARTRHFEHRPKAIAYTPETEWEKLHFGTREKDPIAGHYMGFHEIDSEHLWRACWAAYELAPSDIFAVEWLQIQEDSCQRNFDVTGRVTVSNSGIGLDKKPIWWLMANQDPGPKNWGSRAWSHRIRVNRAAMEWGFEENMVRNTLQYQKINEACKWLADENGIMFAFEGNDGPKWLKAEDWEDPRWKDPLGKFQGDPDWLNSLRAKTNDVQLAIVEMMMRPELKKLGEKARDWLGRSPMHGFVLGGPQPLFTKDGWYPGYDHMVWHEFREWNKVENRVHDKESLLAVAAQRGLLSGIQPLAYTPTEMLQ